MLFIDEVPSPQDLVGVAKVLLLRNICRQSGIVPVLAGTSSKATHFVNPVASILPPMFPDRPTQSTGCAEVQRLLQHGWGQGSPPLLMQAMISAQGQVNFLDWLWSNDKNNF